MFTPYESKPVIRHATQIKDTDSVKPSELLPSTYFLTREDTQVTFKAYEEPKVGDWVVRLTPEDTYHCTDAVFRERNIVPD